MPPYQDEFPVGKPLDWESHPTRFVKFIRNTALRITGKGLEAINILARAGKTTANAITGIAGQVADGFNSIADQAQLGRSVVVFDDNDKRGNW